MSKQFWGILIAIAIIFGVVVAVSNNNDDSTTSSKGTPTNHVEGSSPKGVRLLEYGDYQCPGCGSFYVTVKEVVDKYKDRVEFQYRNLPLTSIHPNAFAAARAAEAAALQNKFWEMHDLLFQANVTYYGNNGASPSWISASDPVPDFVSFAQQLNLNVDTFKKDFASTKVNNLINADVSAFEKTGAAKSTPTFFLNDKKVASDQLVDETGQPSVEKFSTLLDNALKNAE